jgi:hypothetical protein
VSNVAVTVAVPFAGTATRQRTSSAFGRSLRWVSETMRVSPHRPDWITSTVTGWFARVGDRVAHGRAPAVGADPLARFDDRLHLDVERLAGDEAERRAHWRVADRAFADELRIAARIALVDADHARRERVAETLLARAGEAKDGGGAPRLLGRAEPGVAELVGAARRSAGHVEEAHLLRLLVGDRRALGQRIEVESPSRSRVGVSMSRRRIERRGGGGV